MNLVKLMLAGFLVSACTVPTQGDWRIQCWSPSGEQIIDEKHYDKKIWVGPSSIVIGEIKSYPANLCTAERI